MTKTFTKNDVVKFLYQEASSKIENEIHIAQIEDLCFQEEVDEYQELLNQIDSLNLKAPQSAVDAIMQAAKNNSLESA